ncbi:MAG: allophanate hydrolase [Alphaproteobacteria bacterium]
MTELSLDFASLRRGYASGALTPVGVANECLRRADAYADPAVWITRAPADKVLERAEWLAARKELAATLPLYGIPFAVKDNIDCARLPTTAACPAFAHTPERNATVVTRLIDAGAILIGKTNLDQFATGLVGTRSPLGAPRSVFNAEYISGGSSSGSAVAVAAGLVSISLGTDTAGSGRVPAAFNNIVGVKPTRGLLSATGVVPACRSLDCVSVFALTISDASAVRAVAEAYDAADPYSRVAARRALPTEYFRFGILAERAREFFGNADYASLYRAAIENLKALGGEAVEIDFAPFRETGALLYDGPWVAERYAAIKSFIAEHEEAMDPTVRRIITGARKLSATAAFEGQYRLAALKQKADAEWQRADVLLLPTVPTHYKVSEVEADPIETNKRLGLYTNFVNLLDYCAVAVPAGFGANGLPFGVTLIAPAFADASLAVIADRLHKRVEAGLGKNRGAPIESPPPKAPAPETIEIFVVGAHLSGMPLNHELTALGGRLSRAANTAPCYRLLVLPNSTPPKPGLLRTSATQANGIAGEVWSLTPEAFGRFVAKIPAPLGIGKLALEDGTEVSGFLCEAFALDGAKEITALGGWRRYVETLR